MRNVSNKICTTIQNSHFKHSNCFSENRAVYEMSKNVVETERPQTTWCMHVACWIGKVTRAQENTRARAPYSTYPPTKTHTHTHTRTRKDARTRMPSPEHTRTHTHTEKYVILQ